MGNEQVLVSGNKNGNFSGDGGISLKSINLLSGYTTSIKADEIEHDASDTQPDDYLPCEIPSDH